jgi:MraZ protein
MESSGGVRGTVGVAEAAAGARLPVFGHLPFQGTYRTRVEASGRLALPAAFKGSFADAAVMRSRRTEHLLLWTPRGFDAMVDAMAAANPAGMLDPRTRQRFYKSSPRISVDRQSRLVLPPELRRLVGIEGDQEVVLAGAIECIEIWPAERFDAEEAERYDDVELLFDTYSGLPTDPV